MKKLYEKKPVLFAVLCIVVYVMGCGTLGTCSDSKLLCSAAQTGFEAVLCAVLLGFAAKQGLLSRWFLQGFRGDGRRMLYLLPLLAAASWNLWGGMSVPAAPPGEVLLRILATGILAPFLEELIFRGILFRAIARTSKRRGFWWASLGFGIGHAVNFVFGRGGIETAKQLCYASALGFLFMAVVFAGRSLLPTVIAHILINTTAVFSPEELVGTPCDSISTAVLCGICIVYGIWVLHTADEPLDASPMP